MSRVEVEQRGEVDVGHAVRVGGEEAPAVDAVANQRDAPAGRRLLPRVDAFDPEALGEAVRPDERLDHVAPVAEAEHEAAEALLGVDADHVPEDRLPADLNERLRDRLRLLAQARAPASTEDHDGLVHRPERY